MKPHDAHPVRTEPTPPQALGFVAMVAVLYFAGGILLFASFGEPGIAMAEWMLLFIPALLFVGWGGFDPTTTLSIRRPRARALAGAAVLGAGAIPLGWLLGWLQSYVLPVPPDLVESLDRLVTANSPGRLAWLVFLLAVTPAVCEEIVFRGVLLGGTRSLTPFRAIVLNGVVFGLFHVSFETVVRFLPTAYLGIVIAYAVQRTGSLFVGMLMHFMNNATIVLVASIPIAREIIADPEAPPPAGLVLLAGMLFAGGLRLLREAEQGHVTEPNLKGNP